MQAVAFDISWVMVEQLWILGCLIMWYRIGVVASLSRAWLAVLLLLGSAAPLNAAQTCHPLSINVCTMPFPSNFYTRDDVASPTGIRVDLKGSLFSPALESLFPDYQTEALYRDRTGFSAAAAVLIELREDFSPASLPLDGGDAVIVFDRTTGQRVPIRPALQVFAANDYFADSAASVLEIYPRTRFEFGHTLVAVVTKQLKPAAGGEYAAPAALSDVVMNANKATFYDELGGALDYVVSQGIAAQDIVSLTEFTVADEQGTTGEYYDLLNVVENDDHSVQNLIVRYLPSNNMTYATVAGQIRLTDLRNPVDGSVRFQAGMQGQEYWTDFVLKIPPGARYGKVPIAIYGHALGMNKDAAELAVLYTNANRGVATMYIDLPNHGSRSARDGDSASIFLTDLGKVHQFLGMFTQASLDLHSVLQGVRTALATLNVVPRNTLWNRWFYKRGINLPDLDTENIFYEGTSVGGITGATFLATSNDLKGGFLQVAGSGWSNLLAYSFAYEEQIMRMFPYQATGGDAALFFHALQTEADLSDNVNFVHQLRLSTSGRRPGAVALQYSIGDAVVSNRSSERLAELADLAVIGKAIQPVPQLRTSLTYEAGKGAVQIPTSLFAIRLVNSIFAGELGFMRVFFAMGHYSFFRADAQMGLNQWLLHMRRLPTSQ